MRTPRILPFFLTLACGPGAAPEADGRGADTPTDDSGTVPTNTEPPSRPGAYALATSELAIESGSIRTGELAWDEAAGTFVAAWGSVPGAWHVHAATLDADGLAVSPPVQVDDGAYDGFEPGLAPDGAGAVLVVYEDDAYGAGEGFREIQGRLLESGTLEPLGASFSISEQPDLEEYTPAVAWDSEAWFVAWPDDRENTGHDDRRLYGRVVRRDGTMGAVARIGSADSYWQTWPSVAGSDGAGRFCVVWGDYDLVGGAMDAGYRARVYDVSGTPVSDPITLVRYGDQLFDRPAVAWDPWSRTWLVAWTQPYAIHTARLAFDGSVVEADRVLVDEDDGAGSPRLACAPDTNSFVLGYHSWWTTRGWARMLDDAGEPVGERLPLTTDAPPLGTFWQPVAAGDGAIVSTPTLDYARIVATVFRAE